MKLEVGKTYRFKGAGPYREYGEWTVTKKNGSRSYAVPTGTYKEWGETCVADDNDYPTQPDYEIIEVIVVDEIAELFV